MEYKTFLRQFQARVVANTSLDDERMNYLCQFTTGEAHSIVLGYSCLDAKTGYQGALAELERRYGDTEMIADAYIKKALEWPTLKPDDPKGLDAYAIFLTECKNAVTSIDALQVLEYSDNVKMVVKKLPFFLHDKWRNKVFDLKEKKIRVTFSHLVDFIAREARKANDPTYGRMALGLGTRSGEKTQKQEQPRRSKGSFATAVVKETPETRSPSKPAYGDRNTSQEARSCLRCNTKDHSLDKCGDFNRLPMEHKMSFLRDKGACFGCLKAGHRSKDCRHRATCDKCSGRHPTAIHNDRVSIGDKSKAKEAVTPQPKDQKTAAACTDQDSLSCAMGAGEQECTLAVIPVKVRAGCGGREVLTYAFLDTGSSISFCSDALIDRLGISGRKAKIKLNTMGSPHSMSTTIVRNLEINGLNEREVIRIPMLYSKDTMPVSKYHIPTQEDIAGWQHLSGVRLPQIDEEVGLLLGNGVADAYSPLEVRTGPRGTPHATRTLLGWVVWNVMRPGMEGSENLPFSVNSTEIVALEQLEEDKKLENLVQEAINRDFPERGIDARKEPSVEDKLFTEKVRGSMTFKDGRFTIGLPFRHNEMELPDNRPQALKRLNSLKTKLARDEKLYQDFTTFMSQIIGKGYAEEVPQEMLSRQDRRVWYIPHHGVYHPHKPNKIRVVFDCSAKYQGISLNDTLLQGPNLTNDLLGVLLRFREQPTAVVADIEKMFYQVQVPVEDRDHLRFYWWPDGHLESEPVHYRMTVHLFGAASSPACANMALQRTIQTYAAPETRDRILRSFYVDDYLGSLEKTVEGKRWVNQLKETCRKGGLNLTGWSSNDKDILYSIPSEDRAKGHQSLEYDDPIPVERALGVMWDPEEDVLGFKVSLPQRPPTRRGILSLVSSVYDPMGLVAPFVLPAKILLQKYCQKSKGWDDPIEKADLKEWERWLEETKYLEDIKIPRLLKPVHIYDVSYELHTFADASERGYGIAAYVRTVAVAENDKLFDSRLLYGKARVAPLKKMTIPKMELAAATLAVKSAILIQREVEYKFSKVTYWTDSMLVIAYINNTASRFHTFVANRLTIIHEASKPSQWNHVRTEQNPADLASRGVRMKGSGRDTELWFKGPNFLSQAEANWLKKTTSMQLDPDDQNVKKVCATTVSGPVGEGHASIDQLFRRVSTWGRLKKMIAWILRAKANLKARIGKCDQVPMRRPDKIVGLSVEELDGAESAILKYEQDRYQIEENASVRRLDPFRDTLGLVRVGGRLAKARDLTEETKHPTILLRESVVSKLIVRETHKLMGHMGRTVTMTRLRKKFWLIGGSKIIKQELRECVICKRYNQKVGSQKMANLPAERLIPGDKPFTRTGMDYFGPFYIKHGRSTLKRYGVIFSCYAIRAVHIEMANDLDIDSCVNAIRRFTARRGSVRYIRSDNGTNLVGTNRELRAAIAGWQGRIGDVLKPEGITWEFNTPAASHQGGMWERMIRTIRKTLYGLMHEQSIKLSEEGLRTLFCEAEALINSRPLTALNNDPSEPEPLTPNKLLLMETREPLAPGAFEQRDLFLRKKWKQIQHLSNVFWKRWSTEYLSLLQERTKWLKKSRNLAVGDVVLIADNSPRGHWPLARVTDVLTDGEGLVRSARVKTQTGSYLRPVTKLVSVLEAQG